VGHGGSRRTEQLHLPHPVRVPEHRRVGADRRLQRPAGGLADQRLDLQQQPVSGHQRGVVLHDAGAGAVAAGDRLHLGLEDGHLGDRPDGDREPDAARLHAAVLVHHQVAGPESGTTPLDRPVRPRYPRLSLAPGADDVDTPFMGGSAADTPATPEYLRASDEERDLAISALRQEFVEGRLSQETFMFRVQSALGARHRGQLVRLFTDLPPRRARLLDRIRSAFRRRDPDPDGAGADWRPVPQSSPGGWAPDAAGWPPQPASWTSARGGPREPADPAPMVFPPG